MPNLDLKCQCGKVAGVARDITPNAGNRIICYCRDCQAFANHINPDSDILNEFGGTEILQVPPSLITIHQGVEHLACLRLSEKGLHRWYAGCCNTAVGNTVGLSMPFVGLIHTFIPPDQNLDSIAGPVLGSVYVDQATGQVPAAIRGSKSQRAIMVRVIRKILSWKIFGKGRPNPLFKDSGTPIVEPEVVG